MGVLSPVIAQALRGRDPYPGDLLTLDFAGVGTGGRQFYKRNGVIAPRFEMLPGASSIGHAGLGRTRVNGAFPAFAPDAPLIGDGGLLTPEARECIWPLNNGSVPADVWTTLVTADRSAGTISSIITGAVPVLMTTTGANGRVQRNITVPNDSLTRTFTVWVERKANTYFVSVGLVNGAATSASVNFNGETGAISGASTGVTVTEAGAYWRVDIPVTNNSSGNTLLFGFVQITGAAGQSANLLCPMVTVGPSILGPPIVTTGLPATRTAVAQSVGGVNLTPPYVLLADYSSILLPSGTLGSVAILSVDDGTANNRVALRMSPITGALQRTVLNAGVVLLNDLEAAPRSPLGVKAGLRVASDGKVTLAAQGSIAMAASAALAIPSTSRVTLGHGPGSLFLNGLLRRARVRLGDMSDAEFAGLTA